MRPGIMPVSFPPPSPVAAPPLGALPYVRIFIARQRQRRLSRVRDTRFRSFIEKSKRKGETADAVISGRGASPPEYRRPLSALVAGLPRTGETNSIRNP